MPNFNPEQPYNDLPLLPPIGEIETKVVLKACIEARAAVAELKQCCGLIPNQAMLINTIPVLEAQANSEIENIVTTADQLFQYAIYQIPRSMLLPRKPCAMAKLCTRPKVYDRLGGALRVRDLLDLIFIQPYCRIANVVDAEIAHRQTAAIYLKELCEIGVLKETKVGRDKLFIHPRFLELLTAESHTVTPY